MPSPEPCPHCGSQPKTTRDYWEMWQVECPRCYMAGPTRQEPDEAERLWNQHVSMLVQAAKGVPGIPDDL